VHYSTRSSVMGKKVKKLAKPAKTPTKRSKRIHGEDWLERIDQLTLKLENGEQVTFDIAGEVSVPDVELGELRRLEANSPARYAFWSYQASRQRFEVRKLRRALIQAEANADVVCRRFIKEDTDFDVTERGVRSWVDLDKAVQSARRKLNEAELALDIIESVRDAVRARTFTLGRLLNTHAKHED